MANTKRLKLLAMASLLLAVASAFPAAAQNEPPVLNVNIEDAVRSRLERDPGDYFQNGTGFFVANGELVVTSAHVVGGCRDIKIIPPVGAELDSTLLVWDGRRDVAVLRTRVPDNAAAPRGGFQLRRINVDRNGRERAPARVLQPMGFVTQFGVGAPSRARMQSLGPEPISVLVRSHPGQTYEMLRFAVPMDAGTSGSPVIDEHGQVVALVTALSGGLTLGTPLRDIARAIQAAGYDPFQEAAYPPQDPTDYVVRLRCR